MPDICLRALEGRLHPQSKSRVSAAAWHDSGLVFTTSVGTAIDPRNFQRAFVARCQLAIVPVTTVDAARKACSSLLVALDVHPRVAMQILRHSQIAVTMGVYSKVTNESTKAAVRKLGDELDAR